MQVITMLATSSQDFINLRAILHLEQPLHNRLLCVDTTCKVHYYGYITIVLLFGCSPHQLQKLAQALDNVVISKAEIGWDLTELEMAAKLVSLTI